MYCRRRAMFLTAGPLFTGGPHPVYPRPDRDLTGLTMASEYHRGEMDIHEQTATYDAFMALTKWGSLAIAVALLMLVLWFCTPAGFLGGLIPGVVMTVIGILVLRDKKSGGH